MRILRELDVNALEKLLLWESYYREEAWEGRDSPRVRRLLRRVHAAIKALDEQAVRALGGCRGGAVAWAAAGQGCSGWR
jgi:hypothetical protein